MNTKICNTCKEEKGVKYNMDNSGEAFAYQLQHLTEQVFEYLFVKINHPNT